MQTETAGLDEPLLSRISLDNHQDNDQLQELSLSDSVVLSRVSSATDSQEHVDLTQVDSSLTLAAKRSMKNAWKPGQVSSLSVRQTMSRGGSLQQTKVIPIINKNEKEDVTVNRKADLNPDDICDSCAGEHVRLLKEQAQLESDEETPILEDNKKSVTDKSVSLPLLVTRRNDSYDLDEVDLEDGSHDTPAILAHFEEDVHDIERSISNGQVILSSIKSQSYSSPSFSSETLTNETISISNASSSYLSSSNIVVGKDTLRPKDFGTHEVDTVYESRLSEVETILNEAYLRTSFLLKQNQRIALNNISGTRTLTLRVARCLTLARQFFGLNRRVVIARESERDLLLTTMRAWIKIVDSDVADQLDAMDIRSGVPPGVALLVADVWDRRIVPFNERASVLTRKIAGLDDRCNMLAKLMDRQQYLTRFTRFDDDIVHQVRIYVSDMTRFERERRRSYMVPLKIIGIMFLLGLSLNVVFIVAL